ncbi:MAG: glycosyltransferase [Fusicatenibacter saccharivorans]
MLPSYHEGMSNVLLEAAATGRPVITSNIPGCRESVENGKSGLLVEVKKKMLYDGNEKDAALQQEKNGSRWDRQGERR